MFMRIVFFVLIVIILFGSVVEVRLCRMYLLVMSFTYRVKL